MFSNKELLEKLSQIEIVNDIPNGEVFGMGEYIIGITNEHWICGFDDGDNEKIIQLVATYETIDFRDFDHGWDENPYPVTVQCSMLAHPKHFAMEYVKDFIDSVDRIDQIIDDWGGKYSAQCALWEAHSYGGGFPFNPEGVVSKSSMDCKIKSELIDSKLMYGKYRHFVDWSDADTYIREVYVPHTNAIMGMVGFCLDKPMNYTGTTGWDFIRNMIDGTDWLKATMGRLSGKNED